MTFFRTDENLTDLGTRPGKVRLYDVGPESDWELGKLWMRDDIQNALSMGILKPFGDLRVHPETDAEFKEGFLIGNNSPDVFCNLVNVD